jgi:dipeptidyl aminopeptidase/acylaminoacyl peptidase
VKNILPGELKNFLEEGDTDGIGRFVGRDAQSDELANGAALEFALMIKAHAGQGAEKSADGGETSIAENFGAARLVVIFQEAGPIALQFWRLSEAVVDLGEIDVAHLVVEELIVGVGKAEAEQARLGAPIGFGEKGEAGHGVVRFGPEFICWGRHAAEEMIPTTGKNIVEEEHGHITPNTVAVIGDIAQLGDASGAKSGEEMIELGDIPPGRIVRIFGESDEARALRGIGGIKERGILREILRGALDVEFGMFAQPGMIERGVIRDEVQVQDHAAGVQFSAHEIERGPGADARIGNVGDDGVRRTDHVVGFPAGERAIELWSVRGIFQLEAAGFGAALPQTHEPDDVETLPGQGIPFCVGNVGELDIPAEARGKLFEPSVGIDFVEMWMRSKGNAGGSPGGVHGVETKGRWRACQWSLSHSAKDVGAWRAWRFCYTARPRVFFDLKLNDRKGPLTMKFQNRFLVAIRLKMPVALMVVLALMIPGVAWAQNSAGGAGGAAGSSTTGTRPLAVDDYFLIKEVEDPQLSPDGKWVAYTVKTKNLKEDKNEERIWMIATSGGDAIALTNEGEKSTRPRWSPDGKYIAFISARRESGNDEENGKKQVWILNREGGEAQRLTDTMQDVESFRWSPASDRLVLVLQDPTPDEIGAAESKAKEEKAKAKARPWVIDRLHFKEDEVGYLDRRRTHLYVFNIADHKRTQITSGDYDDSAPAWSPDGSKIAFASNRSTPDPDMNFNTDIWVVAADNGDRGKSLVQVTTNEGSEDTPAWSPDGKWIAYTSQLEPKLYQYSTFQIVVSPAEGGEAKVLTRKLDRNSSLPNFSADGKWIYFIADDDGTQNLLRVPAGGGEITRPIGGRKMVESFSLGKDGAVAAGIGELTRPAEVFYLPAEGELRKLTKTNDVLMAELRLPDVEYVHFKSKDGTTVAGYLYKPVDYKPGVRYPAILRPHGGPVWAYYAEFNFDPQLFAANGYVVLTPNPRGSSGYGLDYCKAIFADWGHKDFEDDVAMVDYAVGQGFADPDKLGVGGWSYGGISTDFIITQTTRFKGAISGAGDFLYITNWGHDLYSRDWEYELGLPWENRVLWEKLSPFNRVTKITTPTMIMGGEIDWNVPVINGEQMFQSLKRLGVPTVLVVYPGEYHEFSRPSFIKDRYERYLDWYGHYVKGEGPAIPAADAKTAD